MFPHTSEGTPTKMSVTAPLLPPHLTDSPSPEIPALDIISSEKPLWTHYHQDGEVPG